jgi:hypothetical protein
VNLEVGILGYGYFNIILELFKSLIDPLLIFMPKTAMHFAKIIPVSWLFHCRVFRFRGLTVPLSSFGNDPPPKLKFKKFIDNLGYEKKKKKTNQRRSTHCCFLVVVVVFA